MRTAKYNPISAGVAYTIGNMLIKAIPFITLPIFTRILGTADFGLYNTYLSYEGILSVLIGLGLSGTTRVAKVEYGSDFEKYISSIYGLQIITSAIFDIIAICAFSFLADKAGWFDRRLLIILLVNCLSTQIYNIASAKCAINGNVAYNLILSFVLTFSNIAISLFLCIFIYDEKAYFGRILGTCIATAVTAIIALVLQLRKSLVLVNLSYWKFGIIMGAPLIFHSLSLTLLSQCDKIMIQSIVGDSEAGIYSIAVTLTGIVSVIVSSIDNAWAPWFFKKLEDKQYEEIYRANNRMIMLFTVVTSSIALVSPEIIKIMSAPDYWGSIDIFPILIISVLFNFYYLIPVNYEYYHKKTAYIAFSTVITALINIILNLMFIKFIGYKGAAYATSVSKLILLVMHWIKAWKLNPQKLMGLKEIIYCTCLAIFLSIISVLFKSTIVIRYLALAVLLIATYLMAKKIGYISRLIWYIKNKHIFQR